MNISATEAQAALREIDESADRSRTFKGYRLAAPYFFIWGAIWMIAYGATGLSPRYGVIWLPLSAVGMALSAYAGWRNRHVQGQGGRFGKRMWITFITFALFVTGTYAILSPHTVNQYNAFPALLTAMSYALSGVWTGRYRFVLVGAVVAAATMFGFFYLGAYLSFWLAAIGGGSLILTGFWMRSA